MKAIVRGVQGLHLQSLVQSGRYREAVECYRAIEDPILKLDPKCQLLAGDAAARLGDVAQSNTLVSQAFYQFNGPRQRNGRMRAANLLGAIAFERGRMSHAHAHFVTAHEIACELGDAATAARVGNNLANVAHLKGDTEVALTLYQQAEGVFRALNDSRGGAEASHNRGLVLRQLGRFAEAAAAASDSARLAERCGARSLQGLAVLGQAEVAIERGLLDEAGGHIVRGAALAAEAEDPFNGLEAGRLRALLAFRRGDFAIAHHLAEIAGGLAAGSESALLRAECGMLAALSLRAMQRDGEASRVHSEVLGWLHDLDAGQLIERFERSWGN
jgi:tetratricopeptide (TPR) repeat protein